MLELNTPRAGGSLVVVLFQSLVERKNIVFIKEQYEQITVVEVATPICLDAFQKHFLIAPFIEAVIAKW